MNAILKSIMLGAFAVVMMVFTSNSANSQQVVYDSYVRTPVYSDTYTVYYPSYPTVQPYYYSSGYLPTYTYQPAYTYVYSTYPRNYYYYRPYRNTLRLGWWR